MFLDWSDEDQDKALAWKLQQKGRCDSCGTFDWQWPDEGNDSDLEADGYICFGCERIEREVERRSEQPKQLGQKYGFFLREE